MLFIVGIFLLLLEVLRIFLWKCAQYLHTYVLRINKCFAILIVGQYRDTGTASRFRFTVRRIRIASAFLNMWCARLAVHKIRFPRSLLLIGGQKRAKA
jgi:hypothetical protein